MDCNHVLQISAEIHTFDGFEHLISHILDIIELIRQKVVCLLEIISRFAKNWEDQAYMTVHIKGIDHIYDVTFL